MDDVRGSILDCAKKKRPIVPQRRHEKPRIGSAGGVYWRPIGSVGGSSCITVYGDNVTTSAGAYPCPHPCRTMYWRTITQTASCAWKFALPRDTNSRGRSRVLFYPSVQTDETLLVEETRSAHFLGLSSSLQTTPDPWDTSRESVC